MNNDPENIMKAQMVTQGLAGVQTGLSDERIKTLATLAEAAVIDARIAEDQAEALEQLHVSTALRELTAARAEIARLTAELHRAQLGSIPADDLLAVERWAAMPGRKPAAEAFTAGVRRDIARVVEAATADLTAERDRLQGLFEKVHTLAHEAAPETGIEMSELADILGDEDKAALLAAMKDRRHD